MQASLYNIDDFSKLCNEKNIDFDLVSEVSEKYRDKFDRARILDFSYTSCIGKNLCKLALLKKDEYFDLYKLVPNYLRKSQAERDRKNEK